MKGLGDLNRSGNSSTLTLLKQAESASNGEAAGKGLFEKYSESGSPFDPQAEDEQEEDIHDVTQVKTSMTSYLQIVSP